ncbi:GIY-YIG nuclease family protein [Frigoribacterium sp. CG_9.8]|uniref:GIY-YIG nuclease family protein n=1 Tax=Frigoribacterium sp. CG_9.8 TaxID=2787733 RepID=UPI0018CA8BFA|nr:GIY-YIG nuclease family protein [Frigoribacterium sp. CG_9.8]MBG6107410.1 putative salt-induced outer membrane protein YdiY [Frigoribacterium sp. CG_9.8]
MIRFTDFLPVAEPELTKVKFNIRAGIGGAEAWDLLLGSDLDEWLNMTRHREAGSTNNNLDRAEYVLSFAQYYPYGPQYFIFGGFFRVEKSIPEVDHGYGYDLEQLDRYSEYIKRLIIKLERPVGRDVYLRWYESLQGSKLNPEIYELASDVKLGTFSGFQNVRLRHHELQRIIANDEPSWKDALSSVKGVYVITDLSDGRLYVGSASGEASGLWQRWAGYAHLRNLTGGNKELVRLRAEKGDAHIIENFQYSILEIFDPKTKAEVILKRESFWKLALDSGKHGMNHN